MHDCSATSIFSRFDTYNDLKDYGGYYQFDSCNEDKDQLLWGYRGMVSI
jgi:hypothetical protein